MVIILIYYKCNFYQGRYEDISWELPQLKDRMKHNKNKHLHRILETEAAKNKKENIFIISYNFYLNVISSLLINLLLNGLVSVCYGFYNHNAIIYV